MRRTIFFAVATAVVAATGSLVLWTSISNARQVGRAAKGEDAPRSTQLSIGQVVLFSSGVGYFQREGTVDDDARVDLSFPVADVNDLIKSMVLRDLDGGAISAVSIDSSAPTERTLRSFAIDLTRNPSFSDILNQARGEKVEVALANAALGGAGTLNGTIVGVEKQHQAVNKEPVEVAILNLWCSDGMRGVKLADVQRVRFLNAIIDSEFKKALETLAQSHDTQKKAVSIHFVGEGKRRVRVGYVIENPIWKTSYRLVLGSKTEEKPYLQGWAVVENPTDEDWRDVRMALISGRPISFQMDLYTPLYVSRPTVVPELFQSLRPVAYSGSMEDDARRLAATAERAKPELSAVIIRGGAPHGGSGFGNFGGGGFGGGFGMGRPGGGPRGTVEGRDYAGRVANEMKKQMKLGDSVATAASAAKLGDFFQYAIDKPVSLPRQKSALLPIVGKDVQASRVSIYNERAQAKFPLLGLHFKNTSGQHLMQGPITVFEGSTYAGDARVLDLQPNEERLISYAIDLGTEVNAVPSSDSGKVLAIKAVKGIIHTTTKNRQIKTYQIKNRNEQERVVLIEHPVNNAFRLVGDKPKETASDVYRFEVKVPAGGTKTQVVTQEQEVRNEYVLKSSGDEQVRWFLSQAVASPKVKEGLKEAMALRWATEKTRREIAELQRQLGTITEDQKRIRANLRETPSSSAAHKRYLEKLDQQETQIEKHQADVKKLQAQEHTQQKAFDDFLAGFSAE
jgi:hypothetical protein